VHKDSGGTYGKLRITAELRHGRGIHVGKEQVQESQARSPLCPRTRHLQNYPCLPG
jgi:hypothetical protein